MPFTSLLSQPDIVLWFKEFGQRLKAKSPRWFRILTNINIVIGGIGTVLTSLRETGLFLTESKTAMWVGYIMMVIGAWGTMMTLMGVSNPTIETLPFTTKKNIQKEIKLAENETANDTTTKIP